MTVESIRAYPVSCQLAGGAVKVRKSRVSTANIRAYSLSLFVWLASEYSRDAKNTTYDWSASSQYASGAQVIPAAGWLTVMPLSSPLVRFQFTRSVDSHTSILRLPADWAGPQPVPHPMHRSVATM